MLYDLLSYHLKVGRYGKDPNKNHMAAGFENKVPSDIVKHLDVGDLFFTQRRDSALSWAVMYFTKSDCDHCAVYAGNSAVLHMTLGGSRYSKLDAITRGAFVLPIKMTMPDGGPPFGMRVPGEDYSSYANKDPIPPFRGAKTSQTKAKWHLFIEAINIHGVLRPPLFRLSMFIDNMILASMISFLLLYLFFSATTLALALLLLLYPIVTLLTHALWKKLELPTKPHTILSDKKWNILRAGGLVVYNMVNVPSSWISEVYRKTE